jgi:hypothetical protein
MLFCLFNVIGLENNFNLYCFNCNVVYIFIYIIAIVMYLIMMIFY